MRPATKMAIAGTATVTLTFVGLPSASAEETIESTAAIVAQAVPDQREVAPLTFQDGELTSSTKQAAVTAPTDPGNPITIFGQGAALGSTIEVSLPADLDLEPGKVASDGTLVYVGSANEADAAVQPLTDGSVRLQTVIPSEAASHSFTYTFSDDLSLTQEDDGSVSVVRNLSGTTVTIGQIDPAWSFDAAGAPVETRYIAESNRLTQIVTPAASSAYPIVADPTISFGVGTYYHFNRAETKTLAQYGVEGTVGVTAGCAALGTMLGPAGTAVAGTVCAAYAAPFFFQAGVAENSSPKRCVYTRIVGLTWWIPGTYKDSRCK